MTTIRRLFAFAVVEMSALLLCMPSAAAGGPSTVSASAPMLSAEGPSEPLAPD